MRQACACAMRDPDRERLTGAAMEPVIDNYLPCQRKEARDEGGREGGREGEGSEGLDKN